MDIMDDIELDQEMTQLQIEAEVGASLNGPGEGAQIDAPQAADLVPAPPAQVNNEPAGLVGAVAQEAGVQAIPADDAAAANGGNQDTGKGHELPARRPRGRRAGRRHRRYDPYEDATRRMAVFFSTMVADCTNQLRGRGNGGRRGRRGRGRRGGE